MTSYSGNYLLGWVVIALMMAPQAFGAVPYKLQVVNLEEKLFFRYVDTQGAPLHAERHVLPRLEAELDQANFPIAAIISGYELASVNPTAGEAFDSVGLHVTLPQRQNPWLVASWQGSAGKSVVLKLSSYQASYQELVALAVNTDGVLRRLPIQGVPLFGKQRPLVPDLSSTYLAHALERGTFGALVARYATPLDGLSVVVGRHHDPQYPDTVYFQVQMPPQTKTYKAVLAWKNRDILEKDGNGGKERD